MLPSEGRPASDEEVGSPTDPDRPVVARRGRVVAREAGPWSATVQRLLRHLERVGFAGAPRVVGTGFDGQGRETLTYVAGETRQPRPWGDEAMPRLGRLLRDLHDATASFHPPADAVWQHWFPRDLGGPRRVIGHGDVAPWNVVERAGVPVALIDWEYAGPIDPLVELAQACWLNARLFDDDVAARERLASPAARARQVRLLLDGYGVSRAERAGFVDRMVEYAVFDAAEQVIEIHITPETRDPAPLWGIAWRTRSAAWLLRHRPTLERALG
jgi:Phosphotransferase enzyme family